MVSPKLFGLIVFSVGVLIATYYTIWVFSILVSILLCYQTFAALHEVFLPSVYQLFVPTSSLSFVVASYCSSWRNYFDCALYHKNRRSHRSEKGRSVKNTMIIQLTKLTSYKNNIIAITKHTNTLTTLGSPSLILSSIVFVPSLLTAFCISFFALPVSFLLLTTFSSIFVKVIPY